MYHRFLVHPGDPRALRAVHARAVAAAPVVASSGARGIYEVGAHVAPHVQVICMATSTECLALLIPAYVVQNGVDIFTAEADDLHDESELHSRGGDWVY